MSEGRWPQYSHEPSWRVLTPKQKAGRESRGLETSGFSLPHQLPGTRGLAGVTKRTSNMASWTDLCSNLASVTSWLCGLR